MHTGVENTDFKVTLVGAPNAGKTTLFNWLTGSRYRTVNYPGATVEYSKGVSLDVYGSQFQVLDTPGLYSLHTSSLEEKVTFDLLFKNANPADILIVVVDATQLSRHLYLVRQLTSTGYKVVVALTMTDLLKKRDVAIDTQKLESLIGAPVVPVDGRLGGGVKELSEVVRSCFDSNTKASTVSYENSEVSKWGEDDIERIYLELNSLVDQSLKTQNEKQKKMKADQLSLQLDRWLLHPIFGLIFFAAIMTTIFTSIFWLAAPLMDFVDGAFGGLSEVVASILPSGVVTDFISNGLIAGIGSVLVFVPQIFILFLGLILLEDWGYLARASTLIDKPFSKLGLNGRSFVPILSGYACAIPAMMAARTISNRKERLITIFIIPLMSCSARLPVYGLLLSYLFFGQSAFTAGVVLASIYILSLVIGSLAAVILSYVIPAQEPSMFMLELPTYRKPNLKTVLRSAFDRTYSYVTKAGPVILVLSLVIWCGTVFPNYDEANEKVRLSQSYAGQLGHVLQPVMEPMGVDWRVGIGLISAFAAREVFVSSMALIFNVTSEDENTLQAGLLASMREASFADGTPIFTTSSVLGLIVFFMISLQCLSTVAVSKRETGSWKFAGLQLFVFTLSAYFITVALVQGLRLFGVS